MRNQPDIAVTDAVPKALQDGHDLAPLLEGFRKGDPVATEILARELEPEVRRIAAEVTLGWMGWERDDFIEQALSALLAPRAKNVARFLLLDVNRDSLTGWIATILRNLWRSQCRSRRPLLPLPATDRPTAHSRIEFASSDDLLGTPFAVDDLKQVSGWPVRARVELLCLSGLFVKVPTTDWERFLIEYEQAVRVELVRPFPPTTVLGCDDPATRTQPLAAALGIDKPNTLSQRWKRGKPRLDELKFVRELKSTGH